MMKASSRHASDEDVGADEGLREESKSKSVLRFPRDDDLKNIDR